MVAITSAPALADTQSISQGFRATDTLGTGMLVSFTDDSSKLVVAAATTATADKMAGIVGQNALLELSDGSKQTQVVTSGTTLALVSNINGDITAGDRVTISPIAGVGMKMIDDGTIIGTVQESFDQAKDVRDVPVTQRDGTQKTVKVGLLPVQVGVVYYQPPQKKTILPDFIMQIARVVSGGKEVSVLRVLVAFILLIVGVAVIGVLIYVAVRSSILSIGRNPLAAKAVHQSLFEVGGIAIGILLVTLIAVYLVLVI